MATIVSTLVNQFNTLEAQQGELVRQIASELAQQGSHRTIQIGGKMLSDHNLSNPATLDAFISRVILPVTVTEGV